MKINSRIYKGIEYVQVSDLPEEQQDKVLEALHHCFIKILIDKSIVSNCLQYKDYVDWFDQTYPAQSTVLKVDKRTVPQSPLKMILGKA